MTSDLSALAAAVRERRAILFAGAGLSMSVGLPSWSQLIEHMCHELELDPACVPAEAGYQTLAEYYRLQKGSVGPLRSWMDRTWSVSEDRVRASKVHELVVGLEFPIVYTTNYDNNLETAYQLYGREFVKIANARDVARATEGVAQIVKFHGDFEDDQSLVLAETDYFNRLNFASPLDVKFRADALGRTILFIGYSMSDLNIRLLLHRLWETWRLSGYEKSRPASFVFMPRPNPVQEAVLGQWGITVVTGEGDDPEASLIAFLTELKAAVDEGR
ncbi:SIR2 family protein [Phenylobacterium terrae]|uniref:SIR2 family protein n=1 Tax=Phenylobacterium terrae TaxID=2665495 RepID=A0ABW4N1L6_9CAUL